MSMDALMRAVREHLKDRLSVDSKACEITDDGSPLPVAAGPFFYAVCPGEWRRGEDPDAGLDEYFGVEVVVTAWAGKFPRDRVGPNLIASEVGQGLYAKAERVRAILHKDPPDYPVLRAANAIITATDNGFVEPLLFQSGGRAEIKGPDWFSSDDRGGMSRVGLAIRLSFGGARRIQVVGEQD